MNQIMYETHMEDKLEEEEGVVHFPIFLEELFEDLTLEIDEEQERREEEEERLQKEAEERAKKEKEEKCRIEEAERQQALKLEYERKQIEWNNHQVLEADAMEKPPDSFPTPPRESLLSFLQTLARDPELGELSFSVSAS